MQVKPFSSLGEAERQQAYEQVALVPGLAQALKQATDDPALAHGRNLLTLWADGAVVGTIGVITAGIRFRSEVFLTHFYAAEEQAGEVVTALLAAAYRLAREADGASPSTTVRLGFRPAAEYLRPVAEGLGFGQPYRFLRLSRPISAREDLGQLPQAIRFEPVTPENIADYVQVHNGSFRQSPHGAPTDAAEVGELVRTAVSPEMHQIGYAGGVPAIALRLVVDGRQGDLDLLAVDPSFQGWGLGRRGLEQALRTLRAHGVEEARLVVAEMNTRAVRLYRSAGFGHDETFSNWLVGPPLFAEEALVKSAMAGVAAR